MIEVRNGRRRVVRPGAQDVARMRWILSAICLALLGALALLCGKVGVPESALALALPACRALAGGEAEEPRLPAEEPAVETLSLNQFETLHASAQTLSQSPESKPREPEILIYHTHTTEAYLQSESNEYLESGKWRTKDHSKSVVAVGALLAELLREEYGLSVLHDTANHEPPKLSTAYSRSLETMQAYRRAYPGIRVYIDVHRDAYATQTTTDGDPKDYVELDGKQLARIMFVVGTGQGATGSGFDEMPDFESNYAFAEQITARLNGVHTEFTRAIRVKTGRYNQHVSNRCLLVEVGHNANTLEQALGSVPYLAAAIAATLAEDAVQAVSVSGSHVWLPADGTDPG